MLQEILKEKFHIETEMFTHMGHLEACIDKNHLYLLVPLKKKDLSEVMEHYVCAQHMGSQGENRVFQFMHGKDNSYIIRWKNEPFCILFQKKEIVQPVKRKGRILAVFHYRGRTVSYPLEKLYRLGKWRSYWIKRLEQLEKEWSSRLMDYPENDFERMFLESYPYYMGLAENAIQYLADTEIDDKPLPSDSGTICHNRFSTKTWSSFYGICNPFDWVFDHCSRDLAEWTREKYFQTPQLYEREMRQFFADYQSFSPLSSFTWRLIYARLLFPLHYFECVESYFTTNSEQARHLLEERLKKYLSTTKDYEKFLQYFFQMVGVPVNYYKIPIPEWIRG